MLIKTKKDLKIEAQKISGELGVPLSTIINAFLKQFVRDREITLSTEKYQITPYLEQVIREARAERMAGKTKGPFSSAKEMMDSLNS